MASDAVVRARVPAELKSEAGAVLAEMGLSLSDAVRLLLVRVARERALPFDIRVPNEETLAAMAELDAGGAARFNSIEELMADLNAPD
jgi:DNA-damage-inducible protein J